MRSKRSNDALVVSLTGTIAALAVMAALGALARRDGKQAVEPINASAHWLHGPLTGRASRMGARHTGVGFLTNYVASIFWALPLHLMLSRKAPMEEVAWKSALVSGVAALVDYGLMPKRLRPGWEHSVGLRGVVAGFAALAAGLFAGTMISRNLVVDVHIDAASTAENEEHGRSTDAEESDGTDHEFDDPQEAADEDRTTLEDAIAQDNERSEPATISAESPYQPVGVVPKSEITGRHDEGSDANETLDGLNDTEEMTRQAAEDVPLGNDADPDDVPVFDRGDSLPRV